MSYKDYVKDHWFPIGIGTLFLVTLLIFGGLTQIPLYFLVITGAGSFLLGLGLFCWDYGRKKEFYEELREKVRDLDKAYLLPEILSEPEFLEGRLACQAMKEMGRSMAEQVSSYEQKQKEYKAKPYVDSFVKHAKQSTPVLLLLTGAWTAIDKTSKNIPIKKSLLNNLTGFFAPVLIASSALLACIENKKNSEK